MSVRSTEGWRTKIVKLMSRSALEAQFSVEKRPWMMNREELEVRCLNNWSGHMLEDFIDAIRKGAQ